MDEFIDVIGLGVAGNFTGHLEQAGEAGDFTHLKVDDPEAPKGVFPFYVPGGGDHFLHVFPLSHGRTALPADGSSLQLEPELGLLCDMAYEGEQVCAITPKTFFAYNDCSIRREGASKISQKKNWGADSKGLSATQLPIDRFAPGGALDHYRIACVLVRGGEVHPYGVDSAVASYSYFYQRLLTWLVDRLNCQQDDGPLENIGHWLKVAGRPRQVVLSVGATRYTPFGEHTYLEAGDDAYVFVYDGRKHTLEGLMASLPGTIAPAEGLSVLHQRVG